MTDAVLRSPLGRFGLGVTLLFLATAALAPWLAPYDPTVQSLAEVLRPPSRSHLLGTDQYGRAVRSDLGIMRRHVLPNALAPALVQLTLGMARAILYEASLSFIGLGTPPPTPSWGRMLADTKSLVQLAPWASVAPGSAIALVILSLNFLGDALRDALDPRLRGPG